MLYFLFFLLVVGFVFIGITYYVKRLRLQLQCYRRQKQEGQVRWLTGSIGLVFLLQMIFCFLVGSCFVILCPYPIGCDPGTGLGLFGVVVLAFIVAFFLVSIGANFFSGPTWDSSHESPEKVKRVLPFTILGLLLGHIPIYLTASIALVFGGMNYLKGDETLARFVVDSVQNSNEVKLSLSLLDREVPPFEKEAVGLPDRVALEAVRYLCAPVLHYIENSSTRGTLVVTIKRRDLWRVSSSDIVGFYLSRSYFGNLMLVNDEFVLF